MKRIASRSYLDFNSPGTVPENRGEREPDPPVDWEVPENLPPRLREILAEGYKGPSAPMLLPPQRFSDAGATASEKRLAQAATGSGNTGPHSKTVRLRLSKSCAAWDARPTSTELYEAVRTAKPSKRQRAILDVWAREAEWPELLQAHMEDAYTLRELVAALHRSDLARSPASAILNTWANAR